MKCYWLIPAVNVRVQPRVRPDQADQPWPPEKKTWRSTVFFSFFEELNKNFGTSSTVSFRLIHHLHISSAGIVRLFYLQKIFFSPLFIYSEAALWYIWPYERSSPSGCTALMSHCQLGRRTWSTFICLRLSKQSSGKEKEKHTGGQQRCIW